MSDELHIPVLQEEARIAKRAVATEHVTVCTAGEEQQVTLRDEVRREQVEITRVPIDREVAQPPAIRIEGEVTIVPVIEERAVVVKRLFLVEEVHLRRTASVAPIALPTMLRRTRVDVERTIINQQEDN